MHTSPMRAPPTKTHLYRKRGPLLPQLPHWVLLRRVGARVFLQRLGIQFDGRRHRQQRLCGVRGRISE